MKKNKAFTLIELLAVIIILAIIVLIATPIIINVIDDAKESARQSSISGYADGVRYAVYSDDYIYTGKYSEVTKEWAEANVEVGGEKVDCEEVRFSDSFETVLHKCRVGKSTKEYCYGSGKTYEDCENEEYKSIYDSFTIAGILKEQYNESNTVGLLKDETGYYYTGTNEEVANNFVWFGGHLWRVISIDNEDNLTMITQQPLTSILPASAIWTTQAEYEASYINHWLNDMTDGVFLKSMEETDRDKIQNSTFNVGGDYNSETSTVENIDSITTTNQKVGLLDELQYMKAGGTDSYLDITDMFWLGNRYDTSKGRRVNQSGKLAVGTIDSVVSSGVRSVIKIPNLIFTEGEGTLENPYREKSTTTSTLNIKVGEYISVPTSGTDCGIDNRCLLRVVSKDNNSIKVILNGLLPSTSEFGSSTTYTSGNTVDAKVTAFAETISNTYRYTGTDKTFGIGTYDSGANYTAVQNITYSGNVGLPVVGEMFSGNDIDVRTSAKTFVNVNTIENPTVSNNFWTMNSRNNKTHINSVSQGFFLGNLINSSSGVRPVLFLNNNLNFISGEGTAENPFILE